MRIKLEHFQESKDRGFIGDTEHILISLMLIKLPKAAKSISELLVLLLDLRGQVELRVLQFPQDVRDSAGNSSKNDSPAITIAIA
jgi:hypothetical protein